MKSKNYITALLLLLSLNSFTQINDSIRYTLIGTVVNGQSNTILSGANIVTTNNFGTKTNELGEFSIHTQANDTIKISYIGYKTITYVSPKKETGKYLIKFRMYQDSISLQEVEIFPYPTFEDFKEAFIAHDKQDEQIEIKGVNTYVDRNVFHEKPSVFSPASFIYDRLFDKQSKTRRKLDRRKNTTRKSALIKE